MLGRSISNDKTYRASGRRESAYDKLKNAIVTGEIGPDQPLVETALAEWCEVSRTPIREALTRLEQDGLIGRGERGLTVRTHSPEEILDLYETRIALEAMAARVAASRRSDLDLMMMCRTADRLEAMEMDDAGALREANREFHETVWQASHNESLKDLLGRLHLHVARYPGTTLAQPGRWSESHEQHRMIIAAIDQQDGGLAHEATAVHFAKARDLRLSLWGSGSS